MYFLTTRGLTLSLSTVKHSVIRFYSKEVSKCHYDVIVAGGGMVGTTLTCNLGKKTQLSDKKILLLEGSKEFKWTLTDKYSNRVVALTPSTQKLLDSIGAWNHIARGRYATVKKMQVWDACSDAMITFEHDNLVEPVAYIVENDLLLSSVTEIVKEIPNVTVVNEAKIKDYKLANELDSTAEVFMENGDSYTCNLLLGADGANSKVRKTMGVQYLNWDYKQMGIVATLNLSETSDNVVAWQRFLPTGPIAILPLNEKQSSLIWSTTSAHCKDLLRMSEERFVDELNTALWKVYPRDTVIDSITKGFNNFLENLNFASNAVRQLPPGVAGIESNSRAAFPLGFGHSTNYVAKGVALIGDSAHRVHPLAGQGVNLGFGDVSCLSDLLAEAVYSGRNLGSIIHLKEYEKVRQRHNVPTMLAIDGLQKLYCTDLTPIVVLRSLGLQLTHAINPVKKMIMGHAVG
ncbi:Coenzyme Q6 [Carabus blaptoides fortunei]